MDLVVGDPTFLVMEYVQGPTLAARLRARRRLPAEEAVRIVLPLCAALRTAHSKGVVHRDLKPSNIILAPDDEHGESPRLIDFGLAKIATHPDDTSLTKAGEVLGTPNYMSPEQASSRAVDGRSDIYSLGCMLYEMIAGRPPFTGDEHIQVLYKHVHVAPEPLRSIVADIPPRVEEVISRAMAKDPNDRYASMTELGDALGAVARARGSGTPGAPSDSQRRTAVPKNMVLWLGLPATLLGVVLLLCGYAIAMRVLAPKTGATLLLVTDPAGATVTVDGKTQSEETPAALRGLVAGDHLVAFQREGHAAVERHISLRSEERTSLEIVLPPLRRQVQLRSTPPGATIFVDGKLVLGTTPATIAVTEDDFHEIRLERIGFETLTHAIKPEDREPELSLTLRLEKQQRGRLMVDSNDAAEVWIDGIDTGFIAPTVTFPLSVGAHTVELRAGELHSAPATVNLRQGESVRMSLSLPAGTSSKGQ
jgi:hypothetical protein